MYQFILRECQVLSLNFPFVAAGIRLQHWVNTMAAFALLIQVLHCL